MLHLPDAFGNDVTRGHPINDVIEVGGRQVMWSELSSTSCRVVSSSRCSRPGRSEASTWRSPVRLAVHSDPRYLVDDWLGGTGPLTDTAAVWRRCHKLASRRRDHRRRRASDTVSVNVLLDSALLHSVVHHQCRLWKRLGYHAVWENLFRLHDDSRR